MSSSPPLMEQPRFEIDLAAFKADPYPTFARMRAEAPVAYVPQLDAVLLTRRDHISACEKRVDLFSSHQPAGLMSQLMGENMMRKDGAPHQAERKGIFKAVSPKTARMFWRPRFEALADEILTEIEPLGEGDLFDLYARRLSGEALKEVCGLPQVHWQEIDTWSQALIDGIANYAGDAQVEAACKKAVAAIDSAVDDTAGNDGASDLITVQRAAALPDDALKANIRLAISGGQNEPRDAIAGLVWALLTHPDQLQQVKSGQVPWDAAFDEYLRWIAPIGMSPRRITRDEEVYGVPLREGQRAFFMFSSAGRDETVFDAPERFDITRDAGRHISFGAGPHFCAGAAIARTLVAQIAVPMLFARLKGLRLVRPVTFDGWAFRGPLSLHCSWEA